MHLVLIGLLLLGNIFVWMAPAHRDLRVSFLDIGQGDSILIESPTGVQILVDAGRPDGAALRELGEILPFWDRSLDAVVETHPDQDHIGGMPDVFERYDVDIFVTPGIENDTSATKATERAAEKEGAVRVIALRGMRLILGGGAYADVLFPDRDVPNIETNTGSVVMRVVYGNTSFLLTGDSPKPIEKYLISLGSAELESDVLKAGHHGSKTSSDPAFLRAVSPSYGVFSRGCDNTYGHPSPETIRVFQEAHIPILDTCTEGRITLISDGRTVAPLR